MSSLEIKARNSYAIVALNNLRHKLENRSNNFIEKHKLLILDSIKLNRERGLSNEYFSYSIHGLSNIDKSSAIQLSEALGNSIEKNNDTKQGDEIFNKIKNYMESEYTASETDKVEIINICKKAINYLSGMDNSSSNIFITYDI